MAARMLHQMHAHTPGWTWDKNNADAAIAAMDAAGAAVTGATTDAAAAVATTVATAHAATTHAAVEATAGRSSHQIFWSRHGSSNSCNMSNNRSSNINRQNRSSSRSKNSRSRSINMEREQQKQQLEYEGIARKAVGRLRFWLGSLVDKSRSGYKGCSCSFWKDCRKQNLTK